MKFTCGSCSAKYQIADEKIAGRTLKMRCRKCGHDIQVKGGSRSSQRADRSMARPPSVPPPPTRPSRPAAGGPPLRAAAAAPAPAAASPIGQEFRRQIGGTPAAASPPAPPSALPGDEWHVSIDGKPVGPLSRDEVARRAADGVIDERSLAWREGFEDWRPLGEVAELASLIRARTAFPRTNTSPPRRAGSGASRPPTGRIGVGRGGTGRNNVVPIGARGRTSAPPPVPDDSELDLVFDDPIDPAAGSPGESYDGTAGAFGAAGASAGGPIDPTASSAYGRSSLPPARPGGLTTGSPVFILLVIGVSVFSIGLAVIVGTKLVGGFGGGEGSPPPGEQASDPGGAGEGESASERALEAAVRLPDELDLGEADLSDSGDEPDALDDGDGATDEPASAVGGDDDDGAAASASSEGSGSGGAAPGGAAKNLSNEDEALLARMRGGDISGPTIGTRDTSSGTSQRTASELDGDAVARTVNRNRRSLQQCYERSVRGMTGAPDVTYEVDMTIAPSGRVSRVRISSRGASLPGLDGCLETVIKRWSFPPSASGGRVPFPVVFTPGG
jgi:predicted Zn finger-like uncharacterized protein